MAIMQVNAAITKLYGETELSETFDKVFDIMLTSVEGKVDTAFVLDEFVFEGVSSWELVLVVQVGDAPT